MLEKTLKLLRPDKTAKKAGMFFAAFALTVIVMCASFTEARGDMSETAPTNAKEQILGTNSDTADARQMAAGASAPASPDIPAGQAVTADGTKAETTVLASVQAKPVMIRLSSTASESVDVQSNVAGLAIVKRPAAEEETDAGQKPDEFIYSDKIPLSYELQEYTFQKCLERDLEYELVLAVMWRESRFNTGALHLNSNGTFDSGLMQINDINKTWLYEKHGIDNLMDPYQNIDAGTVILSDLYEKYGEHGAMLAYQYGESGMVRKVNQGVTTSKSVEAAYNRRDYYRELT